MDLDLVQYWIYPTGIVEKYFINASEGYVICEY